MAEFNKKTKDSTINDDIIKNALNAEFTRIHTSESLASKTLSICKKEIEKKSEKSQKKISNMSWVLKFGAPMAVGALVMVIMLNIPNIGHKLSDMSPKSSSTESVPVPSSSDEALMSKSFNGIDEKSDKSFSYGIRGEGLSEENGSNESDGAKESEAPSEDLGYGQGMTVMQGVTGDLAVQFSEGRSLNSSENRTKNKILGNALDEKETIEIFNSIVTQYNTITSKQLSLYESGVVWIQTLINTGVTQQMLINMSDYHDILSGEGYWLLPLKNSLGVIEDLISVNDININNKDIVIDNNDFTFTLNGISFLVSPHTSGKTVGMNYDLIFTPSGVKELVKSAGYKNVSDITIIDINYGMDFVVMLKADEKDLCIPFVLDESYLGIKNKMIYNIDEFVKIIIDTM